MDDKFTDLAPSSEKLKKKELWREKCLILFWGTVPCIVFSLIFGAIFAAIAFGKDSYLSLWIDMSLAIFMFAGASVALGAILAFIGILHTDYCVGFGAALYYGTMFLARLLTEMNVCYESKSDEIAFVIVSLVCYIVWLKWFKPKCNK